MEYSISKTIRKSEETPKILMVLEEKLETNGVMTKQNNILIVEGFNNRMGGICFTVTATFYVKEVENKTIINVNAV
jgi:hypothetical protein